MQRGGASKFFLENHSRIYRQYNFDVSRHIIEPQYACVGVLEDDAVKIDVNQLDIARMAIALGEESSAETVKTMQRSYIDGDGVNVTQVVRHIAPRPDISVIDRLLSERIGGPQDWC